MIDELGALRGGCHWRDLTVLPSGTPIKSEKEQLVKSYDGPKVGHLHGRHTVSRYAVHTSSNKHCTARCRMIKTEEWHLKKS